LNAYSLIAYVDNSTTPTGEQPLTGSASSGIATAVGTFPVKFVATGTGGTVESTVTLNIIPVPSPTPTPTPTPTPSRSPPASPAPACVINVTLSGGGTIVAKNACAQDNNLITVTVNFSRPVSTLNNDTTLTSSIGSCLPGGKAISVKNTNFNDGTAAMTFSYTRLVGTSEVSGSGPYYLAGPYAVGTSSWQYIFGAGGNTTKGTYRVRTNLGGRASVPGQCQDGKAFNPSSNYISIVVQ
jgi:hypothetical protein